jgi:hypothetical protein
MAMARTVYFRIFHMYYTDRTTADLLIFDHIHPLTKINSACVAVESERPVCDVCVLYVHLDDSNALFSDAQHVK